MARWYNPGAMSSSESRRYRVALNAQLLAGEAGYRSAGIHGYLYGLLSELENADDRFEYTVYVSDAQVPMGDGTRVISTGEATRQPLRRIVWEQFAQPVAAIREKFDLVHGLAFAIPLFATVPSVVTVHDLSFIKRPQHLQRSRRMYLSLFTRLSCQRARRVIANSQNTRNDLIDIYGLDPNRVDVAYPGLAAGFTRPSDDAIENFRQKHGLPDRYILYLGTIEPRKNLSGLIRAYHKVMPDGVKLICAGGKGWFFEDVFQTVQELHLSRDVIFPGYVPGDELPLWYAAASVFVYPSSYEGFGIPVLEALACGVPTITTQAASMPEAAGDAALLVPPNDEDALADALRRLLNDTELAESFAAKGPAQAARFRWIDSARSTTNTYARALGLPPRHPAE